MDRPSGLELAAAPAFAQIGFEAGFEVNFGVNVVSVVAAHRFP